MPIQEKAATQPPKITLEQAIKINQWIAGGKKAAEKPLMVPLPYRQAGVFAPNMTEAVALKFKVLRGQNIQVYVKSHNTDMEIFASLLNLGQKKYLNSTRNLLPTNALSYNFSPAENGAYLLSVQPELMKSGRYEIEIHTGPSLLFPVFGKNSTDIGSFWGAPRDNGERCHKGVDIFAEQGTPIVAVTDGYILSAGYNKLGGNHIRLLDTVLNRTYYYAHLDTNLALPGTRVKAGEVIGLLGKTGNAENTAPHLHFSVYCGEDGVVDPLHFIQNEQLAPPIIADAALAGKFVRVTAERLNVRETPAEAKNYLTTLLQNQVCRVEAVTDNWLLVDLPGNKRGFISADYVQPLQKEIEQIAEQPASAPNSIFHIVKQ